MFNGPLTKRTIFHFVITSGLLRSKGRTSCMDLRPRSSSSKVNRFKYNTILTDETYIQFFAHADTQHIIIYMPFIISIFICMVLN